MVSIDEAVQRMYDDVTHPFSVECPEVPKEIFVHGGNGFRDVLAENLSRMLGDDYTVRVVDGDTLLGGKYSLDADFYLRTGRYAVKTSDMA